MTGSDLVSTGHALLHRRVVVTRPGAHRPVPAVGAHRLHGVNSSISELEKRSSSSSAGLPQGRRVGARSTMRRSPVGSVPTAPLPLAPRAMYQVQPFAARLR